jgi:beta-glucoside operon transcriptional antiterminator
LCLITRTFYDVENKYLGLLNEIPDVIISISAKLIDLARSRIDFELNPNVIFTLADHINFSIQRYKKNIKVKMPLHNDIEQLYPKETEIGKYALKLIAKELGIYLPEQEITGIAMNLINSESQYQIGKYSKNTDDIIEAITKIIEDEFQINIKRDSANYSRYVSHMQYLFKRINEHRKISSDNIKMYESLKEEFPKINECALKIKEYLHKSEKWNLNEEELLYLILHINRLCSREE